MALTLHQLIEICRWMLERDLEGVSHASGGLERAGELVRRGVARALDEAGHADLRQSSEQIDPGLRQRSGCGSQRRLLGFI